MRAQYWLSKHCFISVVGEHLVCYDIKRRAHHTLDGRHTNAIQDRVPGWPHVGTSRTDTVIAEDVISDLLRLGILVDDAHDGKEATPAFVPCPEIALLDEYERGRVTVTWADLLGFLLSALRLPRLLGFESFAIRRRLQRHTTDSASSEASNAAPSDEEVAAMRRTFLAFERLRPYLWAVKDQRRSEQLVLLRMLEHRRLRPRWVVGVRRPPFTSRTWLQFGNVVIDESPHVAATYVPIVVA